MSQTIAASVVVSAHGQSKQLQATLCGLARAQATDIVIVDTAPNDASRALAEATAHVSAYVACPNGNDGVLQNAGAQAAQGDRLIFVDDSLVPKASFVKAHLAAGEETSGPVVGMCRRNLNYESSPLLHFLGNQRLEYAYSAIQNPQRLSSEFFYATNFSWSRAAFLASGGLPTDLPLGLHGTAFARKLYSRGIDSVLAPLAEAHLQTRPTVSEATEAWRKRALALLDLYEHYPNPMMTGLAMRRLEQQQDCRHDVLAQTQRLSLLDSRLRQGRRMVMDAIDRLQGPFYQLAWACHYEVFDQSRPRLQAMVGDLELPF